MQALDPLGVYTPAAVKDALKFKGGSRSLTFRYDLLSSTNVYQHPITTMLQLGNSVSNNYLADIKRTAKFNLIDDGSINFLRDRIQPWCRLAMPDGGYVEWPQGVFLLSTPKRRYMAQGSYITRSIEAYDQLLALRDDKVADRYTVAAGVAYTTAITTLLGGTYTLAMTPSALTLPAALEWEPGTTYLRIVNDLLGAINYESASFDEYGKLVCKPYVSPAVRAADFTYITDSESVLGGDVDQTLDLYSVPNKFVLVKSEADQPALRSVYTNSAAGSPTSTVSRGRTITEFTTEQDAPDQSTLDAKVARRAFEASQVYEVVEISTALMPMHSNADVLQFTHSGIGIDAKYAEHAWTLPLEDGAMMSHKMRRVVTV